MSRKERESPEPVADAERLFDWIIDRVPAIFWTTDADLRITSGVGGGLAALGLERDQVAGTTLQEYLGTSDPAFPALDAHLRALAGEATRYEQAWGGQIYQCRVEPMRDAAGTVTGTLGLALDVTDARRSSLVERALFRISAEAEGARDLPAFFAALHSIVGELMYAGNFYLALIDEATGTVSWPYFVDEQDPPPEPRPIGRGLTEYVWRTGEPLLAPSSVDAELVAKGEVDEVGAPAVDWLGVPLKSDGRTFGVVAVQSYREGVRFGERDKEVLTFVARHVAAAYERRTAHEARERTLQLLRATLESTADGILVVDHLGEVVTANHRFAEMWRIPSELLAGRHDPTLLAYVCEQLVEPGRFLAKVRELYSDPQATSFDLLEFKDGRTFERYSHATSIGGSSLRVWSFRDVTERQRAAAALDASQQQLRQAQKMEALGRMAGGIAHDFNNLLTVVSGYSDLAAARISGDGPLRNDIEAIRKAARRAAELTSQLLAVGRRQPVLPRILNLNELLIGLESWLRRLIGEDVELRHELQPNLWNVRADPGQVEQMVLNLVVNARDAMPQGGVLTLATANHDLDTIGKLPLGVAAGPFVRLEVRDTGVGMDRATAERIFEPFFTTKERGKGTGLGLSTLYGIVSQNGGFVEVDTAPGRGSSFQVNLPRADGEAADAEVEGALATRAGGGGETILLVEDDPAVRAFLVDFLRGQGYRLLEAGDGREALAVAAGAESIDALVTDIVMPHLGGIEIAGRLRADRPDLPVLLLTGYAETLSDTVQQPGMRLLAKPVAVDVLSRALREMLDVNRTLV